MRINIYGEEITSETELVSKTVTDDKFGTRTFYGIRVFLLSPESLHSDPADDDRSAVTFWVPWTRESRHNFVLMSKLLVGFGNRLAEAVLADDGVEITREDKDA